MSSQVKILLYAVLTLSACLFGYMAWRNYERLMTGVQTSAKDSTEASEADGKGSTSTYDGYSRAMTFGVLFFIVLLGLGLMVGQDFSQYLGSRAVKVLYNDEGEGLHDPDYEQAEQVWADGRHLEAIRLMREYLEKNPREQHVALRIAEIYEKDLQNFLAAALEYEEVLQHKLPRERWGWAAIHLCNLYLRLNHNDKMIALLQRIDAEYGETQAAEKARKRLALIDASSGQAEAGAMPEESAPAEEQQGS